MPYNYLRIYFSILIGSLLFFSRPAFANVSFEIQTKPETPKLFLITLRINHSFFHGGTSKIIAQKIVPSNQSNTVAVTFTNPIFFKLVHIDYYHPEYLHGAETIEEMPSLLRKVTFPPLHPQKYLDYTPSRSIKEKNPSADIGGIGEHFYYFLKHYLPKIDEMEQSQSENPSQYLPLFQNLSDLAKEALATTTYFYRDSIEKHRKAHPDYDVKIKRYEERLFKDLSTYLAEIQSLLALNRIERNRYRKLQEQIKKPSVIFNSIMATEDKEKVYEFLNDHLPWPIKKGVGKEISWTNEKSQISYNLKHNASFTRVKGEKRLKCLENNLGIDLTILYQVPLPNLKGYHRSFFCHIPPDQWKID